MGKERRDYAMLQMSSTTNGSQFPEGHSTTRPPMLTESNYIYWKRRMMIYLKSINFELWNVVESPYNDPTTPYSQWTDSEKAKAILNAKAMNALFCALDSNKFNWIFTATNAHQIWHTLEVIYEGTSKVKWSKISLLQHRFDRFKMKENETITDMYTRLKDITNSLFALGKTYTQTEMIHKTLRVLTPDWKMKTTVIKEVYDLSKLTMEDLIGNLMTYEARLDERQKETPKKNALAFKSTFKKKALAATWDDSDSSSDYEENLEEKTTHMCGYAVVVHDDETSW